MSRKGKDLHLRLSEDVYLQAQNAAAVKTDGNVSKYIRYLILSQNNRTDPEIQGELINLRKEVNKIGVNINQIAKNHNSGLFYDDDIRRLERNQEKLLMLFRSLMAKVNSMERQNRTKGDGSDKQSK